MLTENFYIKDDCKNVGIKLSGGADSSIIYYILCEHYKDTDVNIYPLTLASNFKPWYIDGAKRVIDIVGTLTGKYPKEHNTLYVELSDLRDNTYTTGQEKLCADLKAKVDIDFVYSGLTLNPPYEKLFPYLINNIKEFKLEYVDIDYNLENRDRTRDWKMNAELIHHRPFGHGDKKLTYEAYKINDMLDKLYPYTYSCERTDIPIEKYKGLDEMKHCNNCFFCYERLYGFGSLV